MVRELEKRNGGQRVGLVLLHATSSSTNIWLDDSVPLYAFDLGERMETLELRTRPREPALLPLRVLSDASDLAAPPASWLCVNAAYSPATVIPQVLALLRIQPHSHLRLLRHTDDGWQWLIQVVAGDVLSARVPPLMEFTPILTPPPAPLPLPLDTSVSDACRRLAGFVPGVAAAEHPLWRPWSASDVTEMAAYVLVVRTQPEMTLDASRSLGHYHSLLASMLASNHSAAPILILRPTRPSAIAANASTPDVLIEPLVIRITFPPTPASATTSLLPAPTSSSYISRPFSSSNPPLPTSPLLAPLPPPPSVSALTLTSNYVRPRAFSLVPPTPPIIVAPPPVAPPVAQGLTQDEEEPFDRLPGESTVLRNANVCVQEGWAAGVELDDEAQLVLTSFRVAFIFLRSSRNELHLPHHSVARIEKVGTHAAEIESKHCFVFRVKFKLPEHRRMWISAWEDAVQGSPFAIRHYDAITSSNTSLVVKRGDEEISSLVEDELERLISRAPSKWRLTEANKEFGLCNTYGRVLATSAAITDEQLKTIATFRSKGRIPILSYVHTNGAALLRSSQPKPGISRWRCTEDERLLEAAASAFGATNSNVANKPPVLTLYDARQRMHAMANQAIGAGVETVAHYPFATIAFLGMPNIHVMRESFARLQSALGVQAYDWTAEGDDWLPALERSEWLAHIKLLMHGALRIANSLHKEGNGVLVHCSDGWDRTSQLVCVAALMLEPHYRTINGYCLLIEKEWLLPGHKFHARCGHPTSTGAAGTLNSGTASKSVEEGRAPIFLQFLDCTFQLLAQFPCAFEFSDSFLKAIADALFSCRFGTFLFNSDKERFDKGAFRAPQLWPHLASRAAEFASPFYVPGEVIVPDVRSVSLRFWDSYFLRDRRTQREGDDTQPEERGRQLKSTCEGLYRQVQEAEKELRRQRRQSGTTATKRP